MNKNPWSDPLKYSYLSYCLGGVSFYILAADCLELEIPPMTFLQSYLSTQVFFSVFKKEIGEKPSFLPFFQIPIE